MTYEEIIQKNTERASVKWWPKYAYHFTDVTNALGIINTGKLFSRNRAEKEHIMINDNASTQVIEMTKSGATSYVRFYFRPMTPTQYHNEGYKHPQIRYDENHNANANVPVPIFFVFNLKKLLADPNTQFAPIGQAGYGSYKWYNGVEKFSKLNFEKIYSIGWTFDPDEKKFRHAELLYPNEYSINNSLEAIYCRNDAERATLLNLLWDKNRKAYYNYRDKIRIGKENMFEKNGLFIDDVLLNKESLAISFADSIAKHKYEEKRITEKGIGKLEQLELKIDLEWLDSFDVTLYVDDAKTNIDYQNIGRLLLSKIPKIPKAKQLAIKIYIEDKLINYSKHSVSEENIIK
ncbi:MAG: DUF4433 domain-containing protein [Muribaculaceae bacterium]|nr:DUF4433 domain-containing protein [Muribaculaceae bacterium]